MYENSETPIKKNKTSILEYTALVVILVIAIGVLKDILPTLSSQTTAYITISILLISITFLFLSSKEIYLKNDGILVKNKLHQYKILWEDVISMAIAPLKSYGPHYEIRTKTKTVYIPKPLEWNYFENTVVDRANLELHSEVTILGIRRWKKKNQKYVHTSLSDWFMELFYKM